MVFQLTQLKGLKEVTKPKAEPELDKSEHNENEEYVKL